MSELLSRGTNGKNGYTRLPPRLQELGPPHCRSSTADQDGGHPLGVYLVGLGVVAVSLGVISVELGYGVGEVWAVAVLAIAAAVSERQRVAIGKDTEASISLIPILFAAVLFGPLAGMIVAAVSNLGAFCSPYMKWAIYTCSHSITGAITGFVAIGVARALRGRTSCVS